MPAPRTNRSFHVYPLLVDDNTQTLAAAAASRTVKLSEKLPEKSFREHIPHAVGLFIECDLDPTFTTAPTELGIVAALDFIRLRADNGRVMIDLQGEDIRALEAYEGGGLPYCPEPDGNSGSTNNFYFRRCISFAPAGFEGDPSDFALPLALLENAVLEIGYGALTDVSADTTAGTLRTLVHLVVIGLDEVRVPPKVEKRTWNGAGNQLQIGDRALVTSLVMLDAATHAAISGGDFGALTLDDRRGNVYSGIDAETLGGLYHAMMGAGPLSLIQGEPRAATDDNAKVINEASPTALVAATASYNPVVFSPPGMRLSKVEVESPLTLRWNGTQATAYFISTRILPRSEDEARELAQRVFRAAKLPYKGGKVKTISKRPYVGPKIEYMPWVFNYR